MRKNASLARRIMCVSGLLSVCTQSLGQDQEAGVATTDTEIADDDGDEATAGFGAAHRLNCGGAAFVDSAGREWSADSGYALPSSAEHDAENAAYDVPGVSSRDARLLYVKRV
jgi:hypothetical protein